MYLCKSARTLKFVVYPYKPSNEKLVVYLYEPAIVLKLVLYLYKPARVLKLVLSRPLFWQKLASSSENCLHLRDFIKLRVL